MLLSVLLAAPRVEVGVDMGPGYVANEWLLTATPWIGGRRGKVAVALQGPLRVELDHFRLRERDWDERADMGRVLRFLRYDDVFRVGGLPNVTLGQGTLVRRYHNNLSDDHHRLGAYLAPHLPIKIEAFYDQLFGPPVVGGLLGGDMDAWSFNVTVVGDFDAPRTLDGSADETGKLNGDRTLEAGIGAGASWTPGPGAALYFEATRLTGNAFGGHAGISIERDSGDLQLVSRVEGALHGPGHVGGQFDIGYLLDREALTHRTRRDLPFAFGGRLGLEITYAKALILGADYTDAQGGERAALDLYVSAPFSAVELTGFWHHRHLGRSALFDPEGALTAMAAGFRLAEGWRLDATGARVRRVEVDDEGAAALTQYTEFMLRLSVQHPP